MAKRANIVIALICLAFAAYYAYLTSQLPWRGPFILGPAFMPYLAAALLFVLAAALLALSLARPAASPVSPPGEGVAVSAASEETGDQQGSGGKAVGWPDGVSALVVAGLMALYAFAIFRVGFKVATYGFMVAMAALYGARRPRELLLAPLVFTLAADLLFRRVFRVPFPELDFFRGVSQWITSWLR